jgi:hypothetical protein
MGRRIAFLAGLFVVGCAAPRPPLLCADGALPCPNQVTTFQCDSLAPKSLPPDAAEVAWMLDGARVPQSNEPPVDLSEWCSGTLVAGGMPMHVELFRGIDGGYLKVEGRDRVWFQAPSEDPAAKRARTCIIGDLPKVGDVLGAQCTAVAGKPFDPVKFGTVYGGAMYADLPTFGEPGDPVAYCQLSLRGGYGLRADIFEGDKGWLRMPGERRLCFVPKR